MRFSSIDIVCHVVDNFGDAGVVYRFAKEFLLAHPLCRVRILCDDLAPLAAMCPGIDVLRPLQELRGLTIVDSRALAPSVGQLGAADIVVEAFGCDIPEPYRELLLPRARAWINLEYLSAESWVDGYHKRQSLWSGFGPRKYFYMPGFTKNTGGVIIDTRVEQLKPDIAAHRTDYANGFLEPFGLGGAATGDCLLGTVFTYSRGFDTLLRDVQNAGKRSFLFVCGEKAQQGMRATLQRLNGEMLGESQFRFGAAFVLFMPFVPQQRFDELLCVSDFNFVRGEDSLVRAILAGKPFIWSAYVQEKRYHLVKVDALCTAFAQYFGDSLVFDRYRELLKSFNDCGEESEEQATGEHFDCFFKDLKKVERSTREMSYFMTRNCNLVKKFSDFLSEIS
jgi:uncharacterized repeat protein (TIGR03837 family)